MAISSKLTLFVKGVDFILRYNYNSITVKFRYRECLTKMEVLSQ